MGRERGQARAAEGATEAVVFSILLFLALLILGAIFPGFGALFGGGNAFLFALAYFIARVLYTPIQALVASYLGR